MARQAAGSAQIIFAAQIINFTVPGFSFDGFYTGLRVYVMISSLAPNLRFGFNVASNIHFMYASGIQHWLFGINVVAIMALFHLIQEESYSDGRYSFGMGEMKPGG